MPKHESKVLRERDQHAEQRLAFVEAEMFASLRVKEEWRRRKGDA